ncbi:MAG: GNAT family N-acetyltransferase [Solirubrobacterales bacterium]
MDQRGIPIRRAGPADAAEIARLLHDFNTEFSEPTLGVATLTKYARRLLEAGEMTVLLGGEGPDAIALLRFRPSVWTDALEAHLQELYVAPALRGRGIGRALLEASMEVAREEGASGIDLNTGETETAARTLYESCGFTNREGEPDGPAMLFYEREL